MYKVADNNEWNLMLFINQIPTAYTDIYREFRLLGAYVSVKRHRPSPISFGTASNSSKANYAQVEHQELWWYPSSGDTPTLHPRQISKAVIVGDNWSVRYIPSMIPTATQVRSWQSSSIYTVWAKKRCPWLPVDYHDPGSGSDQRIPQQSLGYFYVDTNDLGIDVEFDVEVKFRVGFRYRKDLLMNDPNPDTSGAVDSLGRGSTIKQPEQA